MGIEGVDDLKGNEEAPATTSAAPRLTDQEREDQRNAEKAADRDNHNQKTGGGQYPLKHAYDSGK